MVQDVNQISNDPRCSREKLGFEISNISLRDPFVNILIKGVPKLFKVIEFYLQVLL